MKALMDRLYLLVLMGITLFLMVVVWKLTFAHIWEEHQHRQRAVEFNEISLEIKEQKQRIDFKSTILEGQERVKHYLGYRVLEQLHLKDHFHHIDYDFVPDKRSACVACHGDLPHDKIKGIRAFGNMHASFLDCHTCHVRLEGSEKTGVFKWYDRNSGAIVSGPVKQGVAPGAYRAKIVPFIRKDDELQRIDSQELIDFAEEYRQSEPLLNEIQKAKSKKIIHKLVSQKPYTCEDCHQQDAPLLPFRALGYPASRAERIVSTEVVGMIKNYTEFYMPRLLHPGVGDTNNKQPQGK